MKKQTNILRARFLLCGAVAAAAMTVTPIAFAVETTGEPGSASATTTIPGNQLPAPNPPFGGEIKQDALSSKPWWAPRIVPPAKAPNVLLIITDDSGFGVPSTFGGVIPTPTMDRIAENGLRYNRMFSTALCSPTRAALITGRNHHSAGFGVISEQSTGFPGYNSIIAEDKATIGRILVDNGYATSWFGKDHNVPSFASSQAGPFDQWPTGMDTKLTIMPMATAVPPACRISVTTWSAGPRPSPEPCTLPPRSLTTTFAPRAAISSAYARPRPPPAPVMTTV